MSDQEAGGGLEPRHVSDVETLRVLADPVRLAILTALMGRSRAELPVKSVKEIAAEIGEPQTKLYRHVKQLEAAGLIHVAASRMVSGILEQRYQASQRDLMFGPGLLGTPGSGDAEQVEPVLGALVDRYVARFFAAHRAGLAGPGDFPAEEAFRKGLLSMAETRISRERAGAIVLLLQEIMDELNSGEDSDDPGAVDVNVLIGFYSTAAGAQDGAAPPADSRRGSDLVL